MKVMAFITGLLIIAGCDTQSADPIQEFIPGTYVRFSKHEFGTEWDTLVISVQNPIANEYQILRKWKYERVLDGQKLDPEYKRVITSGIYNTKEELLRESQTLAVYTFDPGRAVLFAGKSEYNKLK
jgi:hypothetical protein